MSDSDLENDFNYLRNTRPSKINGLGQYTSELLNDVETKMEHAANTQANLDQIDVIFDNLNTKINNTRNIIKRELPNLSESQQAQVVSFWGRAGAFLVNVFNWIKEKFLSILNKIKNGVKYVFNTVKDCFRKAKDWFTRLF
jgi:hypothetical protein